MTASRVLVEIDGPIAHVTLNRPDKLNGIDLETIDELIAAAESLRDDRNVRAVLLRGAGRSFSAGLDFGAAFADKGRVKRFFFAGPRRLNRFQYVNQVWRELPVPVVAVVQGHCYGAGLQLAACADFRFTTSDSTWAILEAKWGLVPDMAGTLPFSELLPADVLMRLAMTGESFSGTRAAELGLATEAGDDPLAAALAHVEQIVERSGLRHAARQRASGVAPRAQAAGRDVQGPQHLDRPQGRGGQAEARVRSPHARFVATTSMDGC
jgi:enoyl-CoA hydratase/carnithine racemase